VKELLKSVHICQSYRKNKSGTFFMVHGVECYGVCCRYGRRRSLIVFYAIAGVALILSQVIPEQAGKSDNSFIV